MIRDPLIELGEYKDKLINYFLDDEDVCSLVMPDLDNQDFTWEENWTGGSHTATKADGTEYQVSLVGHCFDVPYIDSTIKDARSIICIETYPIKIENRHIKNIAITISVFSHKSMIHMTRDEKEAFLKKGYAGNRIDMAVMAINRALLNDDYAKKFGISKLTLSSDSMPIKAYTPNDTFYGKTMTYVVSDFYITSDMRKELR